MPAFAYQAVDHSGRRIRGNEEAASSAALSRGLETRGLVVVDIVACDTDPGREPGVHFGRRSEVLEITGVVGIESKAKVGELELSL